MSIYLSERVADAAPRLPLDSARSDHSPRSRFLRGAAEPDRSGNPLPWPVRLNYYTINPLGLRRYEAHAPSLTHSRTSWQTLLYWQNLLDDERPEPWAPAILHVEVDLREPVTV